MGARIKPEDDDRPDKIIWHGRESGKSCGRVLKIVDTDVGRTEVRCEEVGAVEVVFDFGESGILFLCPEHYRDTRSRGEPSLKRLIEMKEWVKP